MVVAVLIAAQFALPPLAAHILRDRLARDGRVISVSVSAFPAIELLWHHAGEVDVKLASYHPTASRLGDLLSEAGGVGTLHVSVATLHTGLLTVHDARLSKRDGKLYASAQVRESDLQRAFAGVLSSVTPIASGDGRLELQATGRLFGIEGSIDVAVEPVGGAIEVAGTGLFSLFPHLTVWKDRRVHVESISGAPTAGGMSVAATATVN